MATAFEVLEVLEIVKDERGATLWLANPERRNAMGPDFWRELPLVPH